MFFLGRAQCNLVRLSPARRVALKQHATRAPPFLSLFTKDFVTEVPQSVRKCSRACVINIKG